MSDKKNFSALGRIDEKYVEEADGYSVAPEARRGGAKSSRRRKRFVKSVVGLAAGAQKAEAIRAVLAIVCVGGFWLKQTVFLAKRGEPNKGATWEGAPSDTENDTQGGDACNPSDSFSSSSSSSSSSSGASDSASEGSEIFP